MSRSKVSAALARAAAVQRLLKRRPLPHAPTQLTPVLEDERSLREGVLEQFTPAARRLAR